MVAWGLRVFVDLQKEVVLIPKQARILVKITGLGLTDPMSFMLELINDRHAMDLLLTTNRLFYAQPSKR